jgi:hypothetical protein
LKNMTVVTLEGQLLTAFHQSSLASFWPHIIGTNSKPSWSALSHPLGPQV